MTTPQFHYLAGVFPPEPLELSLLIRLVQPGDVFLDVGANVGLYVAHLLGRLGPEGTYFALEPDPENYSFLVRTYGHNDRFRCLNVAASDTKGTANLVQNASNLESKLVDAQRDNETICVSTCRLDELEFNPNCKGSYILKIDVEGHEPFVIRGISALIERGILPLMLIEYLDSDRSGDRDKINSELRNVLSDHSHFNYYAIDPETGGPIRFSLGDSVGRDVLNILVVPPQLQARLHTAFID